MPSSSSTDADADTEDAVGAALDVDEDDPLTLAAEYVSATRFPDRDPAMYRTALALLDPDRLADVLTDDDARRAFWLNVYNASIQDYLGRRPSLFERSRLLPTRAIFRDQLVEIAGHELSVDDVEHGLLRRSQQSWGFGYVPRFRPDAFERTHRVDERDPRIHFALNCGASSCAPILAYDADSIDAQLDQATRGYLDTEVEYDPDANVARVPRLFSWYRGDFGGKRGIREFLQTHGAIPETATPSLDWRPYDWSLELGQFADHEE